MCVAAQMPKALSRANASSSQCFMPLLCTSNTSGASGGKGLFWMNCTIRSRRPSSWLL